MSKNLNKITKNLVCELEKKIRESNTKELIEMSTNLSEEYFEISQIQRRVDELIKEQLDLAEVKKGERVIHWQEPSKSNWIQIHEEYHKTRDNFFRKIDNFCNHYYSLTNFLATLMFEALPHDQKKGISNKSFHSMIDSIAKNSTNPYFSLVNEGRIVMEINNYRSKELNHRKIHKNQLILKTMTKKEILKLNAPSNNLNYKDEFVIPKDAPDDIVIETISTKNQVSNVKYIVHKMVCELKIAPGSAVHTYPYYSFDYYGHFKKYGEHWHEFVRPGNKLSEGLFKLSKETLITTPELWPALITLQKFMKNVTKIISQFDS